MLHALLPCACCMCRLGPATTGVTGDLFQAPARFPRSLLLCGSAPLPSRLSFVGKMLLPEVKCQSPEGWSYKFITCSNKTQNDTDTGIGNFIGLGNFEGVPDQTRDKSKYQDYSKRILEAFLWRIPIYTLIFGLNCVPLRFTC